MTILDRSLLKAVRVDVDAALAAVAMIAAQAPKVAP
jgi:hypothetical protein